MTVAVVLRNGLLLIVLFLVRLMITGLPSGDCQDAKCLPLLKINVNFVTNLKIGNFVANKLKHAKVQASLNDFWVPTSSTRA
ncbi:hypothetical protein EV426DRAFT_625990 [Tirmania nivea]|nr:hypothetical protein EV426DRAFT_625990 [Tirmania nivea]